MTIEKPKHWSSKDSICWGYFQYPELFALPTRQHMILKGTSVSWVTVTLAEGWAINGFHLRNPLDFGQWAAEFTQAMSGEISHPEVHMDFFASRGFNTDMRPKYEYLIGPGMTAGCYIRAELLDIPIESKLALKLAKDNRFEQWQILLRAGGKIVSSGEADKKCNLAAGGQGWIYPKPNQSLKQIRSAYRAEMRQIESLKNATATRRFAPCEY